jgi:hypothetical protein
MGVNERHEISTAIGTYLAMDCVERGSGYHLWALSGNTPQHFFLRNLRGCHCSKRTRNKLPSHSRARSKLSNNLGLKRSNKIVTSSVSPAWHSLRSPG